MPDAPMIFYPHYCYDCQCAYVSDKRFAWCWSCHSWNVVNCYRETKGVESLKNMALNHLTHHENSIR